MPDWNRSYLDAMGVPVWVSRQAPAVVADTSAKAEPQASHSQSAVKLLAGSQQAQTLVLLSEELPQDACLQRFQQLSRAWHSWQQSEFPLALAQFAEQGEPLAALKDKKLLLCGGTQTAAAELEAESVPSLDWSSADDRKAWWQLLQSLA